MIKLVLLSCSIVWFCGTQLAFAQNVKNEPLEYNYIKLPLTPLPTTIKNYQSTIFAPFEVENDKKKAAYEAELAVAEAAYQKEMQDYPAKLKAAEDTYALEMAEWEKKSLAEKVVEKQLLNENNKPVKRLPSTPYKRSVPQPQLKTSYDYPALCATYIILGGYNNSFDNSVKIDVTLNGFDYTHPKQVSEVKQMTSVKNGVSSSYNETYYHIEFSYRHTMSVRVTLPDGKELFFVTPQELNTYKIYKSGETKTSQVINEEVLVRTYEEKILQENLKLINDLVNDKIGFKRELRKTEFSYVKIKDDTYADLMLGYNVATSALKSLLDDPESAKTKLESVVKTYSIALEESELENKKARIDKEVTTMIYFNLLEVYFALANVAEAEKIFGIFNTMSLSSSTSKQKGIYETLFTDLKKRIAANQ